MPAPPFQLTAPQMRRLALHFPFSHGVSRVDDRRVVSGIIHVIRRGLQWRDAPAAYGPHETLYNRFVRWSRMGVFDRIFAALAAEAGPADDRQHPPQGPSHRGQPAHRGALPPLFRPDQGRPEPQAPRRLRRGGTARRPAADRGSDERPPGSRAHAPAPAARPRSVAIPSAANPARAPVGPAPGGARVSPTVPRRRRVRRFRRFLVAPAVAMARHWPWSRPHA